MQKIRFGRTGLMVSRTSFGGIPIQRLTFEESTALLRRSYDGGINLIDTSRIYSDSEARIGEALSDVRKDIIICSKTPSLTRDSMFKDIETSLSNLKTDYIDVYQFHLPSAVPEPDSEGYKAMLELKQQKMIRHIGISCHDRNIAAQAISSGNFETMQYPISLLSTQEELSLIDLCQKNDVGLLAMKALSGGLIRNAAAAFAFLRQYENVVPIWGIQHTWELDELLQYEANPPALTAELQAEIEQYKKELSGSFCRGCAYCQPCPVEIPIFMAARMSLMLNRASVPMYTTPTWQENMNKIKNCTKCGQCKEKCPYKLDVPELLKTELDKYIGFCAKL